MVRTRSLALLTGTLGVAALLAIPLAAQDQAQLGTRVQEIFGRMDRAQGPAVWDQALALEALGPGAAHEIARQLETARGATRVAAAKALLVLEGADAQRAAAIRALKDAIRGDDPRELRVMACELLRAHGQRNEVQAMVRDADTIRDPFVKIALLKALRDKARHRPADRMLREFLASEDLSVQSEAALALAEMGNIDAAKDVLMRLQHEPTERGRRAWAYLTIDERTAQLERYGALENENEILQQRNNRIRSLEAEIERLQAQVRSGVAPGGAAGADIPGGELLKELLESVRAYYVDEEKAKVEELIDHAATGLVEHLDPFSSYMNQKSLTEFNESIRQQYGGIGAVVQMDRKTGFLTIQRPIYGNPAHLSGLRTLDQITSVEGTSTKNRTVTEMVDILKGPPGTPVRVMVQPFLGGDEREVTITRQQITLKSVVHDMLPGDIGYLQLTQFGSFATREVEEALQDLEKRGMRGLIFDLRGNPGGLLSAAVEIADKFLDDNQLVVYQEGRKGTRYGARQEDGGPAVANRRRQQPKHPDYPVIVLVDEGSASASEIVSGALQAHGRAELVGETTFGKGSVQNIFPLQSMGENAALRMTIAYYYLPDGRLIHRERDVEAWRFTERMRMEIARWQQEGLLNEVQSQELLDKYKAPAGGVEPDYKVPLVRLNGDKQRAYGLIYDLQLLEEYIKARWNGHRDRFHELARYDAFQTASYPEFKGLFDQIRERLDATSRDQVTEDDVRRLLRATVRRFTQDDFARVLPSDFQEDNQLQAAILLMCAKIGTSVGDVAELSFIEKSFPEGVARTRNPATEGQPQGQQGEQRGF